MPESNILLRLFDHPQANHYAIWLGVLTLATVNWVSDVVEVVRAISDERSWLQLASAGISKGLVFAAVWLLKPMKMVHAPGVPDIPIWPSLKDRWNRICEVADKKSVAFLCLLGMGVLMELAGREAPSSGYAWVEFGFLTFSGVGMVVISLLALASLLRGTKSSLA